MGSMAVSGQAGGWSHWHAISTSSDPASSQNLPQYVWPAATTQRQGTCAQVLFSPFDIRISNLFQDDLALHLELSRLLTRSFRKQFSCQGYARRRSTLFLIQRSLKSSNGQQSISTA